MFTMKIRITMILISLLSGCATGSKDTILPQDGPTMKQVYEGHFNGEGHANLNSGTVDTAQNPLRGGDVGLINRSHQQEIDLGGYTRNANNEIQHIFPRLKNKTLIMYVFPHLSKGERYPVPGYSTAFSFYKQTEYALPGEVMEGY